MGEVRDYRADVTFIKRGQELSHSTLLVDGIMCRYKDLRDARRQLTELHVAGDFVDLHGFTLKRLDHNLMTLTPCRVVLVPHDRLHALTTAHPHLARVYWFSTNLDAAVHREWLLSLGRRSALSRMANLFSELHVRLGLVGLTDETGYHLGLTQTDLSEFLGITPIRVNRILRGLRERGLMTFRASRVTLHDVDGLHRVAEFDPAYLYLGQRVGTDQ